MSEYVRAFVLGNAAILGNVCMLPLYPGMVAMFSQQWTNPRARRTLPWLGLAVLAGVVTAMVAFGAVLHAARLAFADVLTYVLPVIYIGVALLGVATLLGRHPFARLTTSRVPVLRRPVVGAFAYGVALGPLTLPCTGPVVISAFTIGTVAGTGRLLDSLLYVLSFSLGFGWPLVALPLVAQPAQRKVTAFLGRYQRQIAVVTGAMLVVVAIVGARSDGLL